MAKGLFNLDLYDSYRLLPELGNPGKIDISVDNAWLRCPIIVNRSYGRVFGFNVRHCDQIGR